MAKINVAQFLGKSKEYEIEGQRIVLDPLKGRDLDLLLGIKEGNEAEGVRRLVMASFDFTKEEYESLPVGFITKAMEAVLDVNGLKKE